MRKSICTKLQNKSDVCASLCVSWQLILISGHHHCIQAGRTDGTSCSPQEVTSSLTEAQLGVTRMPNPPEPALIVHRDLALRKMQIHWPLLC